MFGRFLFVVKNILEGGKGAAKLGINAKEH